MGYHQKITPTALKTKRGKHKKKSKHKNTKFLKENAGTKRHSRQDNYEMPVKRTDMKTYKTLPTFK